MISHDSRDLLCRVSPVCDACWARWPNLQKSQGPGKSTAAQHRRSPLFRSRPSGMEPEGDPANALCGSDTACLPKLRSRISLLTGRASSCFFDDSCSDVLLRSPPCREAVTVSVAFQAGEQAKHSCIVGVVLARRPGFAPAPSGKPRQEASTGSGCGTFHFQSHATAPPLSTFASARPKWSEDNPLSPFLLIPTPVTPPQSVKPLNGPKARW